MLKIFFVVAVAIIVVFVLFAMMCAMIVAGRSDRQADIENNDEADEMFLKKQICTGCKTGKDSYELDKHSGICPYIGCWENYKCQFYVPLENTPKHSIFNRNKNKSSHVIPPKT